MKTLRILKVISLSSVLMLAMAFSCQDHHVPDPVSNCDLVDGTPRAFPCEFEITKVEFLKKLTNQVSTTILPGHPDAEVGFTFLFYPPQPKQIGDFYFAIMNNTTALKLAAAPYNYALLRDVDEGHIVYAPRGW